LLLRTSSTTNSCDSSRCNPRPINDLDASSILQGSLAPKDYSNWRNPRPFNDLEASSILQGSPNPKCFSNSSPRLDYTPTSLVPHYTTTSLGPHYTSTSLEPCYTPTS